MTNALTSQTNHVPLLGRSVEVALHQYPEAVDTILLLHEALGSVAYWKDFPQKLALATGANVLLYSRAGQGNSEGPLAIRSQQSYLCEVREVIPALLAHFRASRPILYGHSEGASLAMLYAATSQNVKMLVLESPFVIAMESSNRHIRKMAEGYVGSHLQQRLARYHQDADAVFTSWVSVVGSFSDGESVLGEFLSKISCPVLVLQGADDEFGSARHLEAMLAVLPNVEYEIFPDTGHLPHRQQSEGVLERVRRFVESQRRLKTPNL